MSYIFKHGDRVVWSPALRVGELYVGLARALEPLLGVESGLDPMASDFYRIDGVRFEAFVTAMAAFPKHPIAHRLLDGIYVTSLAMLDRMVDGSAERLDPASAAEVGELLRQMPDL